MSKQYTIGLSKKMLKKSNGWDCAISDAENMLQEAKERAAELQRSIQTFKQLRDSGVPFPVSVPEAFESNDELMSQERLLGQSPTHVYALTSVYLITTLAIPLIQS